MNNERIFTEAIERHERDIKFASEEWSDRISRDIVDVFTVLDRLGDHAKAAIIAETIFSEFDLFPADNLDARWMSFDGQYVLSMFKKFNAAYHERTK